MEVVNKGSILSYNNFGNWAHTAPENLIKIIKEMIKEGFADQQVATMDLVWDYENGEREILWEDINPEGSKRTYSYLLSDVVPWLRSNNISEKNIMKMIKDTPAKIFE